MTISPLLLELDTLLSTLKPEQFDLDTFVNKQKDCGTVACVAGWLCLLPSAKAAGIELIPPAYKGDWFGIRVDGEHTYFDSPDLAKKLGMSADAWFSITTPYSKYWEDLLGEEHFPDEITPQMAREALRHFVKELPPL